VNRSLPPFLLALGLERDADERAVRRAYAQRLKRIDQAADAQGFQTLRDAYESALHWVKLQARREAMSGDREQPKPSVEAPPAKASLADAESVAPLPLSPPQAAPDTVPLGDQVFAVFAARAAQKFNDEVTAREALDAALADDRLVNLEARSLFEWRVACLLMEGWRPGHEFLFGPACACFNWEQDRRRLTLFGELGAALDAAINEKLIFFRQPPQQFDAQRRVIRRLRDGGEPTPDTLIKLMPLVRMLVQRYPNWLRIVTSRDNVVRWHQAWEALPQPQRLAAQEASAFGPVSASPPPKKSVSWWWIAIVLFALIKLVSGLPGTSSAPQPWHHAPAPAAAPLPPLWREPLVPPADTSFNGRSGLGASPRPAPLFDASAPAATAASSHATAQTDEKLQDLKRRQRQAELELKKIVDEAKRVSYSVEQRPAPVPKSASAPTALLEATDPTESPLQWSTRSKYELLRQPDGSASVPRLGQ
jgi:protein TonB